MSLVEQAERNDGSSQIHVKNIDGTGDIALTSDIWSNVFPVWSPDSRRLAFLSERDGNYNTFALYVMDADGNNVKQLTQPIFDAQDWGYSWSPDGRWVVKSFSTPGNASTGLYRINVETGEKLEVFRQPGELVIQKPAWQPGDATLFAQYFSEKDALSTAYPVPTDAFSRQDDAGDGFIARIPVAELQGADDTTIVEALVTRWLEHYQNDSKDVPMTIRDYTIDRIVFLDETLNPGYQIVAGVRFSIIPAQIPNAWASFPGETIEPEDVWWNLSMPVGVFRDGNDYRMRLVSGWGT